MARSIEQIAQNKCRKVVETTQNLAQEN